jgi:putative acetyltransferase
VGAAVLKHILKVARGRAYVRASLEAGAGELSHPAHALCARFGIERCGPFGDDAAGSNSVFMRRELA